MLARILAYALSPMISALLGLSPPGTPVADEPELAPDGELDPLEAAAEATAPVVLAEQVIDVILPCGVRVITAKDASLPVAAVVLAIEVGTRDDPDKLPGLIHALAYHLQQGNRELAPGEGIATAHDSGGLAAMAVGVGQVRFESLVPVSALDAQLRVEALRLRAPSTGRELWLKSLSYARNDDGIKLVIPREAMAAAWNEPSLEHDGRGVGQALGDMVEQSLGAQLARVFDYRHATLVVVGPDDPQALLERVEVLFAGLPPKPRKTIAPATPPKPAGAAPRVLRLPRQAGDTMVWAVPGSPQARAWAQVLCGTLNRQKRGAEELAKARLRCTYADDPRRPLLVVRAIGFEPEQGPEPMIAARLARIAAAEAEPELAAIIEDQRARIESDLAFSLRAPLELASYLASAAERRDPADTRLALRPRAQVLGLPQLATEPSATAQLGAVIPGLLDTRAGVLLLNPEQPAPTPVHEQPAAQPPAQVETP